LQSAKRGIFRLRHGEVVLREVSLDEDEVIQGNLQSGVASARSTKSLLNESAKRKHSTSRSSFTTTLGLRELPDDLNHLGSRIDEAVDEVDLSVALPYQLRWRSLIEGRRSSRMLALLHWRQKLGAQGR